MNWWLVSRHFFYPWCWVSWRTSSSGRCWRTQAQLYWRFIHVNWHPGGVVLDRSLLAWKNRLRGISSQHIVPKQQTISVYQIVSRTEPNSKLSRSPFDTILFSTAKTCRFGLGTIACEWLLLRKIYCHAEPMMNMLLPIFVLRTGRQGVSHLAFPLLLSLSFVDDAQRKANVPKNVISNAGLPPSLVASKYFGPTPTHMRTCAIGRNTTISSTCGYLLQSVFPFN